MGKMQVRSAAALVHLLSRDSSFSKYADLQALEGIGVIDDGASESACDGLEQRA
jgi:hypothetical protein